MVKTRYSIFYISSISRIIEWIILETNNHKDIILRIEKEGEIFLSEKLKRETDYSFEYRFYHSIDNVSNDRN